MLAIWKPHNYQITALSFLLSNPRSGLFLDPGLGKTAISLSAMKILKHAGMSKGVLMIAPLRVCYSVWPGEIKKWASFNDTRYSILHGKGKTELWGEQKDLYIINNDGLEWLHDELLNGLRNGKKSPFNTLWIDESTKFKNHRAIRFDLLVNMLPLFKHRHIMTGTPAPKGLLDLWAQIFLLDEGQTFGINYNNFRAKYFQASDWNKHHWQLKDFADDSIHKKIAPVVLEMSSCDYLDIPPISYHSISVSLPANARKTYNKMQNEFFITCDDMEASADAQAQAQMKCHQIANGNVYEDIPENLTEQEVRVFKKTRKTIHIHNAKREALSELVDELNGKPLFIAYHYQHDLASIRAVLGRDVPHIGRGVSMPQGLIYEKQWNNGELNFLVGHPGSMAHGLNLQDSGNDICWYSMTWNLEHYLQFIKRIWRQGVKKPVRVHHLIAEKTVDELMLSRLSQRAKVQQSLRDAIKKYRATLS